MPRPTPTQKQLKEAACNPRVIGIPPYEAAELLARRAARKRKNHTLDPHRFEE